MHYLKDSKTAMELFNDDALSGFFDQLITYQIILDLLYKNGDYQDLIDTFTLIRQRQLQGSRYPKHSIILVFAACYKINTPESFEYAKKVWSGAIEAGHIPLRRATTFMAALALKQNSPHVSLEVLTNVKGQNYVSVRALKSLALSKMKRFDDVIPVLRSILEINNPMQTKQTIPFDVINELEKEFSENNHDKDLQADFEKAIKFLKNYEHVLNQTIDDILCSEIQLNFDQSGNHHRIGNPKQAELDRPSRLYARRPGLHELN